MKIFKIIFIFTVLFLLLTACDLADIEIDSEKDIAQGVTSRATGTHGGYFYSFWDDGQGSVNWTLGDGGNFGVTWSNTGNFVGGKGWNPGGARTITWSGSANGAQFVGVYGWMQNPLVEYYIPRSGGSNYVGTYQADGRTYTLTTEMRYNKPSIEGTATFEQYFAGGGSGSPINFGEHLSGWQSLGKAVGNQNYCIVAVEGWGGSSGSANITVGGTSTPPPNDPPPSGSNTIVVRARGTSGSEQIRLTVGGSTVQTWTLGTSMSSYTASTNNTGGINVQFINDGSNRDVQVDYITVNGSTRQAENQSSNTAVYQNGSCGGSNSEWMHCNGYIGFGDVGSSNPPPNDPPPSGGQINFRLRARSTDGQGQVNLRIGNQTIATFTLGSSMGDYTASTYSSGDINLQFYNDTSGRDVQVDYLSVNGSYRQAENQSYNTAVYQNGSCGGSNSEWMHCNGVLGFGDTP